MIVVLEARRHQGKPRRSSWTGSRIWVCTIHVSEGEYQTVLGLVGDTTKVDMDLVASLDIVDSVKRVTEPFKCCNRKFHPEDTVVEVGDVKIGGGNFCVMAGPCSVEI